MCSDFPFFAFVTGLGGDMEVPSPRSEIDAGGEDHHVGTEPRLQPASNLNHAVGEDRLEGVPSSPSPLALQSIQLSGHESMVNEAESTTLSSSSPIPILEQFPDIIGENNHVTVLSNHASISDLEASMNAGEALEEHILAVHPQLDSIPEETTEDDAEEEAGAIPSPLEPNSVPLSAPATFPAVEYATEPVAWTPLAPSIPIEAPTQAHTAPQSFIETQSASNSVPPTLFNHPLYPEDSGDASSTASTTGEASSVFDDDYYSDTSSYTASLLSDVKNYAYENGRRYHSYREGHYVLPNDEQEQDRQDLLHHVRNLVLNGALLRAPVGKEIQRVLDIGTGTGIWAIDFADSFPSAEVIGTDLSPIQPSWVPPNLRFLVDDAESPWLYSSSRPFDFIHARDLGGAIANWPRLLRQAYEHLRPGGWVELQEFEVTLRSDDDSLRLAPTLCEFLGRLHEASEAFHRPMNIAEGHRQRMVEAGFEDVSDEVYKVPSSAWSRDPVQKQIGRYNLCSLLMAVESYSLALFTRVLGWSNNETQVFLAGVRRDLRNPDVHTYCNLHIVYGRKPWHRAS
ncbi:uncharacterized protein N7498_000312 [Penicillium cinerascens]|uniref:Methyltransferase domain-containing protein n=1 Tax=Penicillium cinerascens TaxID=70096 RepID=A0A9W9NGL9_9EURO|nr:uncharacterized protein N7498_000312 [Penicillium cinerascens]KAJ5218213.1 hypothetical protein N7498_000312 [Penicillium cinerascens]